MSLLVVFFFFVRFLTQWCAKRRVKHNSTFYNDIQFDACLGCVCTQQACHYFFGDVQQAAAGGAGGDGWSDNRRIDWMWINGRHTDTPGHIQIFRFVPKKINKWRAFCIITLVFCFILERHHSLLVMTYIFDMTIHMSPPNIHISFTFSHSNFAFFSSYFHFVYFNITFHVWRCAVLHFIIMLCMSIELYYMLCIYEDDQKWWNCIFRTHEKAREIKTRNKTNGK